MIVIYFLRFIGHEDPETYFTETERTRVVSDNNKRLHIFGQDVKSHAIRVFYFVLMWHLFTVINLFCLLMLLE